MSLLKKLGLFALAIAIVGGCAHLVTYPDRPLTYPQAQKVDVVDDYHGVKVADPYRWLEDPDAPETRQWIEAENKITFAWLEDVPAREKIKERITKLWDYEKYSAPYKQGGRYFFSRNEGLQNQAVRYWAESLDDEPRVLIDPNTLSEDGTVSLRGLSISDDGKLAAYGLSSAGSDWIEYYVREVDTGKNLDDHIEWVKFSGASWDKKGEGFYYSRFDEPKAGEELHQVNFNQKMYYHRLGTPQSQDDLIYARPDHPDWFLGGGETDDGEYLVLGIRKGDTDKNLFFYRDAANRSSSFIELIGEWEGKFNLIDNDGPVFFFQTDMDAPKNRVIAIDTRQPDKGNWKTIIPEADEVLRGVSFVNDTFVASYLKDAHTQIKMYDINGKFVRDVKLPGLGTAYGFGGKREYTETFYVYTCFNDPGTIYRYDMPTGKSEVYRRPEVDFDPDRYVGKQVFYTSKDGTRVPMFITHKKGLRLDGRNPTKLYGYGGFNYSLTPYFSVSNLIWMEMGGVYVAANIRGGGEYGREWHEAGMRLNKQNVFDDFIAAAEWLIENKYTRPDKLAMIGGSNGGLLVAACLNQRPDLFGACIAAAGVMDMLRFDKYTIGRAWVSDYGSADNEEEFKALYAYSPYHNIEDGKHYPPTLVTTADHDDRVVPAHSFKYTARLQEAQGGDAPILIRIETRAGHGGGTPTMKRIEQTTDIFAFLVRALKMDPKL